MPLAIIAALALALIVPSAARVGTTHSGVRGLVTISGCPGPQRPGENCTHSFKGARIRVVRLPAGKSVRSFRSGDRGLFRIRLAPGRYKLVPQSSGISRAGPISVSVRARHFRYVHIDYDSGIR